MSNKYLHRITIDLPADIHKKIKIASAQNETTLREIIIQALEVHPYFKKIDKNIEIIEKYCPETKHLLPLCSEKDIQEMKELIEKFKSIRSE